MTFNLKLNYSNNALSGKYERSWKSHLITPDNNLLKSQVELPGFTVYSECELHKLSVPCTYLWQVSTEQLERIVIDVNVNSARINVLAIIQQNSIFYQVVFAEQCCWVCICTFNALAGLTEQDLLPSSERCNKDMYIFLLSTCFEGRTL